MHNNVVVNVVNVLFTYQQFYTGYNVPVYGYSVDYNDVVCCLCSIVCACVSMCVCLNSFYCNVQNHLPQS